MYGLSFTNGAMRIYATGFTGCCPMMRDSKKINTAIFMGLDSPKLSFIVYGTFRATYPGEIIVYGFSEWEFMCILRLRLKPLMA